MSSLLNLFLDICLFRKCPQDVPRSSGLLNICLLAYALSGFTVLLMSTSVQAALLQVTLDIALMGSVLYWALLLYRRPERFEQTFSALTGSGTLITLLALPLIYWSVHKATLNDMTLPLLLMLGLVIWSIAIIAHIVRHAFDTPLWLGSLYAFVYTIMSWTLTSWFTTPQTG